MEEPGENESQTRRAADSGSDAATLLAVAGHELRTPIGAILTLVELLQTTDLDDQQRYFLKSIQEAASMGLALAEDILHAGRAAKGRAPDVAIPYSPARLIDEVMSMMTPGAEQKGLSFGADTEGVAGRWVVGNSDAVRRILVSLCENALKYTEHGSVEIAATLEAGAGADGMQTLVLAVCDTGPGLLPRDQERLYRAFERGSGVAGIAGTGLGLWIVHSLVAALGGTIAVDSERGKGTTFTVRIPAADADPETLPAGDDGSAAVQERRDTGAPLLQRSIRVLVVDDNRFSREIALACLGGFGMEGIAVDSGEKALAALGDAPFDLVLLDLTMPGLDGFETLAAIQGMESVRAIPVIAMSAWSDKAAPDKLAAAGFNGRIDKPFKPGALYRTILEAVGDDS